MFDHLFVFFFFFKQKTAYEMRISDWISDVCSSDLGEVPIGELALVGDDQPAELQRLDIGLERGRVHRDEHVGRIARGLDRGRAEVDLERRNAEQRALRRTDFGGEIGEGRQVVARQRGRQGERSEEHTSELQSLMLISYAFFCLTKKN